MLIACQDCHRQYDVGALEPGKKVRCYCGVLNVVPNQRCHDLEMLHCAACGGDIQRDEKECGYCGSELKLADKGVGDACPECMARLTKGAKFCSSCGTAIRPQTIRKAPTNTACPRCEAPLSICEIPGGSFTECTGCGGIWLEERSFHEITEKQESSTLASYFPAAAGSEAAPVRRRSTEKLVKYLACPECGDMMNRKNFARCSGVIIDWCKGHGYWFDTDELELIVAFIQKGGLEKSRRREIDDQKAAAKRARDSARSAARIDARIHGRGSLGTPMGGFDDGFGGGYGRASILHVLSGILSAFFD